MLLLLSKAAPDTLSVISLYFLPWPLPVCLTTTIVAFPRESSFYSVHIIKVLKLPFPPSTLCLPLPFYCIASGLATHEVHCWFTHWVNKSTWQGRSLLLLRVSFSPQKLGERWGSTLSPSPSDSWAAGGLPSLLESLGKVREAGDLGVNSSTPWGVSASYCALAGVGYRV